MSIIVPIRSRCEIFPGVPEALRRLKSRRIQTNRHHKPKRHRARIISRDDQYRAVEAEVLRQLGDGLIDATYYCPDAPGQHSNVPQARAGNGFRSARETIRSILPRSFLIGDKEIDVECGRNAGVRTILVQTGIQRDVTGSNADWIADDCPQRPDHLERKIMISAFRATRDRTSMTRGSRCSSDP